MKIGSSQTPEEDSCLNLLKIEVRIPKTLAPLLLCKRFTLPDSATPRATHRQTHTYKYSYRQRQQQACESNRGSSKERRPGQRLCMGSNSSRSMRSTEKRTGERESGEQGRGCAWAETQRVRCCQQQQQYP